MSKYFGKKKIGSIVLLGLLMAALTACSSKATVEETKDSEIVIAEEAVIEEEAADEVAEPEPTPEAVPEPTVVETVEPTTEEAPVYEGIDMESTLSGAEWIQTFVGIIDEPKVVIFNDETGRKEIIENEGVVNFNPDIDLMAVYLTEGVKFAHKTKGLAGRETIYENESCIVFKLDSEEVREKKRQSAAIYVEVNGEEVALTFDFRPE